ncbi:hypothetical protein [Scytonema sp. NUACC26]|uniref:hypothetical protein n=1 Tax=Scytonema sp. NUACC26 TaxID=3140176 RepID=UPI0038B372CB
MRTDGQVFIVDSCFESTSTAKNHVLENDRNIYITRKLNDDQEFKIVKIFYSLEQLNHLLIQAGFQADVKVTDNYFIYASGIKSDIY